MPEPLKLPQNRKQLTDNILALTEDAFAYCRPYWEKIKFARSVYNNEEPHTKDPGGMGKVRHFLRGKSLYNQAAITIDAVTPWLAQGMPRAEFLPDVSNPEMDDNTIDLPGLIEIVKRWFEMYEEVDNEGDLHALTSHNVCVDGIAIRKVGWHRYQDRLISPVISPLSFFVDPGCTSPDLLDAGYCGQHDVQSAGLVKMKYPRAKLQSDRDRHTVKEIWIREEVAKDLLKITNAKRMVRAVLVDEELVPGYPKHTPWMYPDFPYICWRNFLYTDPEGLKPSEFWGVGYAQKLWRQQKVLDLSIADFMLQLGNISAGKLLTKNGAIIDDEHLLPQHGLVIELEEGFDPLTDVRDLPPEQINAVLFQWITWLIDAMQKTTGTGEVFTGEVPFSGASGRAIAALQSMAFTHISNLIRSMIGYKIRQARVKLALIQQNARMPVDPNLWRQGVDLKREFPEEARHIGVTIQVHDTSELPQTPAGRLQAILAMANQGYFLSPEKFLELTGFDKGYGISAEDFSTGMTLPPGGQNGNLPLNFEAINDRLTPDQV